MELTDSGDVVSMFLLAGLLNHGLHHQGRLLVTFNLAAIIGELLHRLHHLQLLVAHGFWGIASRARASIGTGTGAGAGAGTAGRRLWSGAVAIPAFLGIGLGGILGAGG